jgi:hypothetical protein
VNDLELHAQPDALEIDVDDSIPVLLGTFMSETFVTLDRRVVAPNIEATERIDRSSNQVLNLIGLRNIGGYEEGFSSVRPDVRSRLFSALDVLIGDHNLRALASVQLGASSADPLAAASDDSNGSFK